MSIDTAPAGIQDFELLDRLGQSCMTEVWKAYQPILQRTVMVKFLKPEFLADREEVEAFTSEAKVVASLSHPNIIGIYDAVETPDRCFIVLEYVAGPSIQETLAMQERMAPSRAIAIASDVALGMGYAWEGLGLVHRNLTPKTILIDSDGTTKIAYLGHSMRVNVANPETLYGEGEIVGTPNYMSPEQAAGAQQLDCRSDIYALGATLYHMLTGAVPFAGLHPEEVLAAQQKGYLPSPRKLCRDISPGTVRVLERMMMRDPDHRQQSWESVARDLAKAAQGHIIIRKGGAAHDSVISTSTAPTRKQLIVRGKGTSSSHVETTSGGQRKIIIHKHATSSGQASQQSPSGKRRIVIRRAAR